MFKNAADRLKAWEGVVTRRTRSSPDGQNMYHSLTVELTNGTIKQVPVPGSLWNAVAAGDRLVKHAGEADPSRVDDFGL
jgi:predicted cupin superfamily sugar epimerase